MGMGCEQTGRWGGTPAHGGSSELRRSTTQLSAVRAPCGCQSSSSVSASTAHAHTGRLTDKAVAFGSAPALGLMVLHPELIDRESKHCKSLFATEPGHRPARFEGCT